MNRYVAAGGFDRDTDYIPDRITRDSEQWPVEPGRYRLIAAKACPWATRSIIVRQLLGLEDVSAERVLGGIDAMKLRSSMTLFACADPDERLFTDVLDRFYDGEHDDRTARLLG